MDKQLISNLPAGSTTQNATELVAAKDVDYMTIEGMKSQEYSVGIFIFMVFGVLVFLGIIGQFIWLGKKNKTMKKGEMILLIWIILGTVGASVFGAMQLLQGRLF
ncbi:MAG: hypothetical protein GC138_05815 [Gammaproteobacteria bacterium]|nr:hypothetical protein [Gammaproteobacteria bacterium]